MRQPDTCLCFGGNCWKQYCPFRPNRKRKDPANEANEHTYRGTILRLTDSLAEIDRSKKQDEQE